MPGAVGAQSTPKLSPLAGKPAPKEMLVDVAQLEREYFERRPDLGDPNQMVSFGTSGHGIAVAWHVHRSAHSCHHATICDYRQSVSTDGPLYMGKDTHAVSDRPNAPRWKCSLQTTSIQSFNEAMASRDAGKSHEPFLFITQPQAASRGRHRDHASHNPPEDGGFQIQPNNGGPADTDVTRWWRTEPTNSCEETTQA